MPSLETSNLYQWAVYWEKTGDDRYAKPIMAAPVEIRVRWGTDESQQGQGTVQVLDAMSEKIRYDVNVVVNLDMPIGSQLWLGTLCGWLNASSSGVDEDVMEVGAKSYIKDLKGRATRRMVYLRRFKNMPGATS